MMNAWESVESQDGDFNLVEMWLRVDRIRWLAGAFAGLFAGLVMAAFAILVAAVGGAEVLLPFKVAALPFLGAEATAYGNMTAVVVGLVFHELLSMLLGMIYAHFTGTNSLQALLGAGLVWGIFSWIFITCLFSPAFKDVLALNLPVGAIFPLNLAFGISLTSVAFFDRLLRGDAA